MSQNQEATDYASLLEQILPKPSDKIITNRFQATELAAPCAASCSGQCHGFV